MIVTRTKYKAESGFTLVELLMVTVLLSIMVGVIYGTLGGIFRAQKIVDEKSQISRTAQFVLAKMIRELSNFSTIEALSSANSQGSSASTVFPKPRLQGERETKSGKPHDSLRFISNGTGQANFGALTNYGLVEIKYSLQDAPTNDPLYQDSDSSILVREEKPAMGQVSKDLAEILKQRTIRYPMAEGVVSLSFRYRNDEKWEDTWNEPTSKAPQAVEITLVLKDENDLEHSFKTAVAIPVKNSNSGL